MLIFGTPKPSTNKQYYPLLGHTISSTSLPGRFLPHSPKRSARVRFIVGPHDEKSNYQLYTAQHGRENPKYRDNVTVPSGARLKWFRSPALGEFPLGRAGYPPHEGGESCSEFECARKPIFGRAGALLHKSLTESARKDDGIWHEWSVSGWAVCMCVWVCLWWSVYWISSRVYFGGSRGREGRGKTRVHPVDPRGGHPTSTSKMWATRSGVLSCFWGFWVWNKFPNFSIKF